MQVQQLSEDAKKTTCATPWNVHTNNMTHSVHGTVTQHLRVCVCVCVCVMLRVKYMCEQV